MKKVLIAGGSGLIGKKLTQLFRNKGWDVRILSRRQDSDKPSNYYYWDTQKREINFEAFTGINYVINLAGENISNKAWTTTQKKKIIDSRLLSAQLIGQAIKDAKGSIEKYIGASAVGYYGAVTQEEAFNENDSPADDFLGRTCVQWENAHLEVEKLGVPTSIVRIGVVFDKESGAFPKLVQTLKFGFISSLGSGQQTLPWIHVDDLAQIFLFILEHDLEGIYNAAAPYPVNMDQLVDAIKSRRGAIKLPRVPSFIMKTLLGEMSNIVLEGSPVDVSKIFSKGFKYHYPDIDSCLNSLL